MFVTAESNDLQPQRGEMFIAANARTIPLPQRGEMFVVAKAVTTAPQSASQDIPFWYIEIGGGAHI
jgi:hypothetical protein